MKSICRLCSNERKLKESHIIPSFVFKWLKESSGTGFIRGAQRPNLRIQDGPKPLFLCDDCESLFNKWETEFANSIFIPFNEGHSNLFSYGKWLLKFAVSVSWRVLNFINEEKGLSQYPQKLKENANNALSHWKRFLLNRVPHPAQFEQHILLLGPVKSFTFMDGQIPTNINRYILRATDFDAVFGGEKTAFVYSKMGPIVLIGLIKMPYAVLWKGTKIRLTKGVLGARRYYSLPIKFAEYFFDRAKKAIEFQAQISPKQKKKIEESYNKDKERGFRSESFKAKNYDIELFGRRAVFEEE